MKIISNLKFLKEVIEKKVANSILIKLNQIKTVTETLETMIKLIRITRIDEEPGTNCSFNGLKKFKNR